MICSPRARSYHALLRMPWCPGWRLGEDRRVVRERDRRQARHRAVLVRGAHRHEPRDVRRLAPGGHVVEDVRVGAVEQEADHVPRPARREVEHVGAHDAVLAPQVGAVVVRCDAEQLADRRRDVDEPAAARDHAVVADALARDHERRPGLHDAGRSVLAPVAALVLPVVRRRVDHAEVRRGRVVEQLGDRVEGVRVGVDGPVRVGVCPLVGERGELVGRLVGEGVDALAPETLVAVGAGTGPPEGHGTVVGPRLVAVAVAEQHHVDDRARARCRGGSRAPARRRPRARARVGGWQQAASRPGAYPCPGGTRPARRSPLAESATDARRTGVGRRRRRSVAAGPVGGRLASRG